MGNVLEKEKTKEEAMRDAQWEQAKAISAMKRGIRDTERDIKKRKQEIERHKKSNDVAQIKTCVRHIVTQRRWLASQQVYLLGMESIKIKMKTMESVDAFENAMDSMTSIMRLFQDKKSLSSVLKKIGKFEGQRERMDMQFSVVMEAIEDATSPEDDDALEEQEMIDIVLDEMGLDRAVMLDGAPKSALGQSVHQPTRPALQGEKE